AQGLCPQAEGGQQAELVPALGRGSCPAQLVSDGAVASPLGAWALTVVCLGRSQPFPPRLSFFRLLEQIFGALSLRLFKQLIHEQIDFELETGPIPSPSLQTRGSQHKQWVQHHQRTAGDLNGTEALKGAQSTQRYAGGRCTLCWEGSSQWSKCLDTLLHTSYQRALTFKIPGLMSVSGGEPRDPVESNCKENNAETPGAAKRLDDVLCDSNKEKPHHWARHDFESAQAQLQISNVSLSLLQEVQEDPKMFERRKLPLTSQPTLDVSCKSYLKGKLTDMKHTSVLPSSLLANINPVAPNTVFTALRDSLMSRFTSPSLTSMLFIKIMQWQETGLKSHRAGISVLAQLTFLLAGAVPQQQSPESYLQPQPHALTWHTSCSSPPDQDPFVYDKLTIGEKEGTLEGLHCDRFSYTEAMSLKTEMPDEPPRPPSEKKDLAMDQTAELAASFSSQRDSSCLLQGQGRMRMIGSLGFPSRSVPDKSSLLLHKNSRKNPLEKEGVNVGSYEVSVNAKYREKGDLGSEAAEARDSLKKLRVDSHRGNSRMAVNGAAAPSSPVLEKPQEFYSSLQPVHLFEEDQTDLSVLVSSKQRTMHVVCGADKKDIFVLLLLDAAVRVLQNHSAWCSMEDRTRCGHPTTHTNTHSASLGLQRACSIPQELFFLLFTTSSRIPAAGGITKFCASYQEPQLPGTVSGWEMASWKAAALESTRELCLMLCKKLNAIRRCMSRKPEVLQAAVAEAS
ncbi:hypothetical protein EK904_012556, partial [Melospiza melodia maxima]